MGTIITNVQTSTIPGLWQRMAALQEAGVDIGSGELLARMEELSIPRDQSAVVHAVTTWARSEITAEEGFSLWLLRERQDPDGGFRRLPTSNLAETNPTIRYVQLAVGAGERPETDEHLQRALGWLAQVVRSDGGVPDRPGRPEGEAGTTARTLLAITSTGTGSVELGVRLGDYLIESSERMSTGIAWRTLPSAQSPVTGATALAAYALSSASRAPEVVNGACQWLLSVQNDDGGWPEAPLDSNGVLVGSRPSASSNTFTVVRCLLAADRSGIVQEVDSQVLAKAIDRARRWCLGRIKSRHRTVQDAAFTLRLAVALGLEGTRDTLTLVERFREQTRRDWTRACDLYTDVELLSLALQEWRIATMAQGVEVHMMLPLVAPPFLRQQQIRVYDLLYRASSRRSWILVVDRLAAAGLAEAAIGATLGAVSALALLDDRVLGPLADPDGTRTVFAVIVLGLGLLSWVITRVTVGRSRSIAVASLVCDLFAAFVLTAWTFGAYAAPTIAGGLLVFAANFLVTDVVAYSADQSGVIARLLPDG